MEVNATITAQISPRTNTMAATGNTSAIRKKRSERRDKDNGTKVRVSGDSSTIARAGGRSGNQATPTGCLGYWLTSSHLMMSMIKRGEVTQWTTLSHLFQL